jgi:hypothetical protein
VARMGSEDCENCEAGLALPLLLLVWSWLSERGSSKGKASLIELLLHSVEQNRQVLATEGEVGHHFEEQNPLHRTILVRVCVQVLFATMLAESIAQGRLF